MSVSSMSVSFMVLKLTFVARANAVLAITILLVCAAAVFAVCPAATGSQLDSLAGGVDLSCPHLSCLRYVFHLFAQASFNQSRYGVLERHYDARSRAWTIDCSRCLYPVHQVGRKSHSDADHGASGLSFVALGDVHFFLC